jgi:hypothetical protein
MPSRLRDLQLAAPCVLNGATIALYVLPPADPDAPRQQATCPQNTEAQLQQPHGTRLPLFIVGQLQPRDQIVDCCHRVHPQIRECNIDSVGR